VIGGLALALGCWHAPAARAGTVAVGPGLPTINVGQVEVAYDAGSDRLTVNGLAQSVDRGGVSPPVALGRATFALNATVGARGDLAGGNVVINGKLGGNGPMQTLLTGGLSAMQFPLPPWGENDSPAGTFDPIDFMVQPKGGALASLFPPDSALRITGSGFIGSWGYSFSNRPDSGSVTGEAVVVAPLPGAVWLLGSGLALIVGLGRVRRST
jgi:hypothetical protein